MGVLRAARAGGVSLTDLAHWQVGHGPPVLLVQGVGVAGQGWRPQIDGLSDRFACAWLDNRGIGASPGVPGSVADMAQDALAVMDALGWASAHVVGHSLGGVIAQQIAVSAPDRVRSLTLMCTFARGRAALDLSPAGIWRNLRTLVGTRAMRRRAFFELVSDPAIPADEANIAALEQAFGRALCDLPPAARAQVGALVRADLRDALGAFGRPALVLSGRHDHVAPASEGVALGQILGVDAQILDGGHAVPVQDPDRVNALLAGFLGRADAPR